jgi:hypothetical protein
MKYRVFTRTQVEEYVYKMFNHERLLVKITSVQLLEETVFATWLVSYTIKDAKPSPTVPALPVPMYLLIEQRVRKEWPSGQKKYYLVPKQGRELPKGYKSVYAENDAMKKEDAAIPQDSSLPS